MNRREMLIATGALTAGFAGTALGQAEGEPDGMPNIPNLGWDAASGKYVLPDLPYAYEALEPVIDAQTMKLHHDIHHQGYVNGLNGALDKLAAARQSGDLSSAGAVTHDLAFNGAGHVLHTLFWQVMAPAGQGGGGKPTGKLAEGIDASFGSFDAFKAHFIAVASGVKGSGWGILGKETISGNLVVLHAHNHENLTTWSVMPLLCIDVWEHAYYLKYQNKRKDYVTAFFDIINWKTVGMLYDLHG